MNGHIRLVTAVLGLALAAALFLALVVLVPVVLALVVVPLVLASLVGTLVLPWAEWVPETEAMAAAS